MEFSRSLACFAILCLPVLLGGEVLSQEHASNADSTRAEIMAQKLHKGIVLDVTPASEGMPIKVLYEAAQLDAIMDAGFCSIRIYVVATRNPSEYKSIIDDALERGLAVVISLWGDSQWISKPLEGMQEFAQVWDTYADYYKNYPDNLVFDLWNEPAGLFVSNGESQGIDDPELVMNYLDTVIPVIRKISPGRILGIGGPGLNGGRELAQYLTPQYLSYKLEDGTGFAEDSLIIGLFHMYHPSSFTHWITSLASFPGWEDEVREELSFPITWSEQWQKPIVLSEWGAWAPPSRSTSDFETYLRFIVKECLENNIKWIYYSAGFNNQWAFNILNTDDGWNQDALDILTGVKAHSQFPLSPIINAEFGWATDFWLNHGTITTSVAWNTGMSGPSALRIQATKSDRAEVYQETPSGPGNPPNRYLISMSKGKSYKISFLARSLSGTGIMKVGLSDGSGFQDGFWTSDPVIISGKLNEYSVRYNHNGADINNVRLSFLFHEMDQVILLDQIALRAYPLEENILPNVEIISPQDSSIIHIQNKLFRFFYLSKSR
jgi:endoglucanase